MVDKATSIIQKKPAAIGFIFSENKIPGNESVTKDQLNSIIKDKFDLSYPIVPVENDIDSSLNIDNDNGDKTFEDLTSRFAALKRK